MRSNYRRFSRLQNGRIYFSNFNAMLFNSNKVYQQRISYQPIYRLISNRWFYTTHFYRRFWTWYRDKLGILKLNNELTAINTEVNQLKAGIKDFRCRWHPMNNLTYKQQINIQVKKNLLVKKQNFSERYTIWDTVKKNYTRAGRFIGRHPITIASIGVAAFEFYLWQYRSKELSTIDPDYYQNTSAPSQLLNALSAVSDIRDGLPDAQMIIDYHPGISVAYLTGAPGLGKRVTALEALKQHYSGKNSINPGFFLLEANHTLQFQHQVINLARALGWRLLDNKPINYVQARDYIKHYFEKHPGWLLVIHHPFDKVDDKSYALDPSVQDFFEVLAQGGNTKGKVILTDKKPLNKMMMRTLTNFPGIINGDAIMTVDLNHPGIGLTKQQGIRLFSRLCNELYAHEKLTIVDRTIRSSEIIQFFSPGAPHNNTRLKQELVEQLGCSPEAIILVSQHLKTEYRRTELSPQLLIARYLHDLRCVLKQPKGGGFLKKERLIFGLDSKFSERQIKYYDQLHQAIHQISLNCLEHLSSHGHYQQRRIARAAQSALTVCLFLDSEYLDQRDIEEFLNKNKQVNEAIQALQIHNTKTSNRRSVVPLTQQEKEDAIQLLCDYGLIRRYHPGRSSDSTAYTHLYFDDNLKTVLKKVSNKKVWWNVSLVEFLRVFPQRYHLKNAYLKTTGMPWEYFAHCVRILEQYPIDQPISAVQLRQLLNFLNPVLNISIQTGQLLETKLLTEYVERHFIKPANLPKEPILEVTLDNYKSDYVLSEKDEKAIQDFCKALFKKDPQLPALYAQYRYYPARRVLKTALPKAEQQACEQAILLATLMRREMRKGKVQSGIAYEEVSNMRFDTETFERDGLGWRLLERSKNLKEFIKAHDHFNFIIQFYVDKLHSHKCLRFKAQIKCRLAKLMKDESIATISLKEGKKLKTYTISGLLAKADEQLRESSDLSNKFSVEEEAFAKSSRLHLVYYEWLQAMAYCGEWQGGDAELNKALENTCVNTIKGSVYHQPFDYAQGCYRLAKALLNRYKRTKSTFRDEILLTQALQLSNEAINIIERTKLYPHDETSFHVYWIHASLLKEQALYQYATFSKERDTQEVIHLLDNPLNLLNSLYDLTKQYANLAQFSNAIQQDITEIEEKLEENSRKMFNETPRSRSFY